MRRKSDMVLQLPLGKAASDQERKRHSGEVGYDSNPGTPYIRNLLTH